MRCFIYLLDDQEADRERARAALRSTAPGRYRFREFAEASEMLAALENEAPDVLILDLDLGTASGLAVLNQLAPAGEVPFPVVVLSGANSDTEAVASLRAGAHDYVSKDRLTGPLLQKAVQYARDSFQLQRKLSARQRELEALNRELEQKDRAKLLFVASASHELRTPVAGMMGLLSLLQNTPLDGEQQALLGSLNSCCHSLLICVDDIIDMAKIEAGQLEIRSLPFDLAEQVSCSLEPLRILAMDKSLELTSRVHPDLPRYVTGDPGRLRQLLNNLVGNAIKFTSQGSVTVEVMRADEMIRFEVRDTGVGVASSDVGRLFEPHFQAGSRDSRSLGSGLGLTISANIVRFMGGQIGVRSALGVGSTFWIELPLEAAAEGMVATRHGVTSSQAERRLKLLVAEDNPIVSKVIKAQLGEMGHDVTLVRDGREAVTACATEIFDAVIMDCQMPLLNGYDATRIIRESGAYKEIPIIALTAQAFTGEKEKCIAAGMTDYLIKPVTPAELQNCLNVHTRQVEAKTGPFA